MLIKKILILIIYWLILFTSSALAITNLAQKVSGKILLQVQSHGEAWYVNPADYKKYYLGRPKDAFDIMQNLSMGITNNNLEKIPIGILEMQDFASTQDDDRDGLSNSLEDAIGTNPQMLDSDNDGFDDKTEIENNYNPFDKKKLNIDYNFTKQNLGKIFLQTEKQGQAWYLNPSDQKRYYLGRPIDAWNIMKELSLGISDKNLSKITTSIISTPTNPLPMPTPTPTPAPTPRPSGDNVIYNAATTIRSGDINKTLTYFIPELHKAIEYTINFLDDDGKLAFANILSGATLSSSTADEKIYSNEVYFGLGGYNVTVNIHVKKQEDGSWLISKI